MTGRPGWGAARWASVTVILMSWAAAAYAQGGAPDAWASRDAGAHVGSVPGASASDSATHGAGSGADASTPPSPGAALQPTGIRVTAAFYSRPVVEAWVDARAFPDAPIMGLGPDSFRVTVGGHDAQVTEAAPQSSDTRGTAYVLVFDVSKSVQGRPFQVAIAAAKALVGRVGDRDQMALITCGDTADLKLAFTGDKAALTRAIDGLEPRDRNTKLLDAVRLGQDLLSARVDTDFPRHRMMLTISDGKDEGSGVVIDDLTANPLRLRWPVYAVGYKRSGRGQFATLQRLAEASRGHFAESPTVDQVEATFDKLLIRAREGMIVRAAWDGDAATIERDDVKVQLVHPGGTFVDQRRALVLAAPQPAQVEQESRPEVDAGSGSVPAQAGSTTAEATWWRSPIALGVGGSVLLALALLLVLLARRPRRGDAPSPLERDPAVPRDLPDLERRPQHGGTLHPTGPVVPPAAPGQVTIRLAHARGPGRLDGGGSLAISSSGLILGRDGDVSVAGDSEVSSRHCQFSVAGSAVVVEDLGSTNGTWRNGARVVGRERVETGDMIRVGTTELRVTEVAS